MQQAIPTVQKAGYTQDRSLLVNHRETKNHSYLLPVILMSMFVDSGRRPESPEKIVSWLVDSNPGCYCYGVTVHPIAITSIAIFHIS